MINKEKITLKKFLESEEWLGIHCDSKEEIDILLRRLGKTSINIDGVWRVFGKDAVYIISKLFGFFIDIKGIARSIKIYEFKDIVFEEK